MQKTSWCVITGAPCSGKTTVIRDLERHGFSVVHEVARAYIEQELAKGRALDKIRGKSGCSLEFQQEILYRKWTAEIDLPYNNLIFLDRGLPDSIGYYMLTNHDIQEPLKYSRTVRYKKIFFFERVPLKKDSVRNEEEETVARLDELIWQAYKMLDYEIIFVPLMASPSHRTEFILNNL